MRIAICSFPGDLSAYVGEMLKTWGLPLYDLVRPEALPTLNPADVPVVICPASNDARLYAASLIDYARRGGTVVCFLPEGELATAAGLEDAGEKELPLRLRITEHPAGGLAGELLPIVGHAHTYRAASEVKALAYLSHPARYEGESLGITEQCVGQGTIIAFAFDLTLGVLMLRQGDPARVGVIPAIDDYPRASHLAADIGPADAGWAPFADLLSHFFVETVQRALRAPTPLLWHLPAGAASIVLFSGDEDSSTVAWNEDEMDYVAAAGARMNLYVIPTSTRSTRADVQRYTARHDVGPHPDLEAMRNRPAPELLKELERQIRIFQETFQAPARSLRTHCLIWAGYMEHVEALERLGVRMDSSYFCARLMRGREFAPYEAFGAAMPMRFCRPDGRLFQVFQQHLHLSDDLMFGNADYSYKLSPQQFKVILRRILSDSATRFHTPYAVIIHPENWALFSRPQGQEILRQAAQSGIPVWSFDQWLTFWEARDTWLFDDVSWDGASLQFTLAGSAPHDGLCFAIPTGHAGMSLDQVKVNGEATDWRQVVRYGKAVALVSLPPGKQTVSVRSTYGQYLRNACGSASGAV